MPGWPGVLRVTGGSASTDKAKKSDPRNTVQRKAIPDPPIDLKKQRRQYIAAVRAFVMTKRAERLKEFLKVTHPGMSDYQ